MLRLKLYIHCTTIQFRYCCKIIPYIAIIRYFFSEESVIGGKTAVLQSNYSMILCVGEASSCPESIRNAAGELQMVS